MTDPNRAPDLELRNTLVYLATAIGPPVADAAYQYLQSHTASGQPIDWGQLVVVVLMSVLAAYVASTRPKSGHAEVATLTDTVGHAAATTALRETAAAQIGGVATTPFTPEQVAQLVAALHEPVSYELEQRMKAETAEEAEIRKE